MLISVAHPVHFLIESGKSKFYQPDPDPTCSKLESIQIHIRFLPIFLEIFSFEKLEKFEKAPFFTILCLFYT